MPIIQIILVLGYIMNFQNIAEYYDTSHTMIFSMSLLGIFVPPIGIFMGFAY